MTQVARHDSFMVAADFESYWQTQGLVAETWRDPARWWQMAVLNTARVAWFSSDRTIREYATEIWNVGLPATRAQASERLG
jgi:starch phosphorylase